MFGCGDDRSRHSSAMQSFEIHEAGAGNPQEGVPNGGASHAATRLAFSDDELHKCWAFLVCLVLATILVDLVNLVVAAAETGETFETHCVGIVRSPRS